jgi:hypothetical protein
MKTWLLVLVLAAPAAGASVAPGVVPTPLPEVGDAPLSPAAVMSARYQRMPGCAKRISIASTARIYALACGSTAETASLHWQSGSWKPVAGGEAHAIAAVQSLPYGQGQAKGLAAGLLAISADGTARFAELSGGGSARGSHGQIQEAASGGGWLWAISPATDNHLGGTIRRSAGVPAADCAAGNSPAAGAGTAACPGAPWQAFGTLYATRIAVGLSDGLAWIIGEDGKIYRQLNSAGGWIEQPGCATAIASAGKDQVWSIGCGIGDAGGNRGVYQWNGGNWTLRPGSGVEIAVQADGKPWVVQADGSIWRLR